jgi:hypothetical protein
MFEEANTCGIFQFESSGMRNFLRQLKPNSLDDIIAAIALFRPGASSSIDEYIKRKHGEKKIEYLDDSLISITKNTYGILIYQEQIMQLANLYAGYTLGEADILRRAMSKKKLELLKKEEEKFIKKSIENNHTERWNRHCAPFKVLACLDFGSEYMKKTDIDSTQVASDLSVMVQWEEKFNPRGEFEDDQTLAVQRRYLQIADKAGIPAILVLTSRKNSLGIVCGESVTGIDWDKLLGTVSAFYDNGDLESAKSAIGNGIADIYGKSNVVDIVLNETAKAYNFKTVTESFWKDYKNAKLPVTVDTLDSLLKQEFNNL